MPNTPTANFGDTHSIGQLASHWDKPIDFVRRMISEGKLTVDERGVVTNAALHAFYKLNAAELD